MLKFADMPPKNSTYNFFPGTYTVQDPLDPNQTITQSTGLSGASGLGRLTGGIADLLTYKGRIADARGQKRKASETVRDYYDKIEEGAFNFELDPMFGQAFDLAKTKSDRTPLERSMAVGMDVLNQGDARFKLASMPQITQGMTGMETQMREADLQRELGAMGEYAAQRQGVLDRNRAFQNEAAMQRLEDARLAKATATQNIENLKAAKMDAFGNIAQGAFETIGAAAPLFGEKGMKVPSYGEGGMNAGLRALKEDHPSVFQKITGRKAENGMKYQMGGGMNAGILAQIMGGQGGPPQGQPPVQGPLPGPASHETNPIHMVNNDGEKVAEAMGGEFIINGDQSEAMMSEYKPIKEKIESGEKPTEEEWMAFYGAVDSVLGQPQFQDNVA